MSLKRPSAGGESCPAGFFFMSKRAFRIFQEKSFVRTRSFLSKYRTKLF